MITESLFFHCQLLIFKKQHEKDIYLFTFISFGLSAFAQHLHQVLILNEGYFDYTNNEIVVPASVGVYDPTEKYLQSSTGAYRHAFWLRPSH